MLGVFVNAAAVLLGSAVGLLFRKGIPEKISSEIMIAIGFCTLFIGIQGAFKSENILVAIVSMVAQLGQFDSPFYTNLFVSGTESSDLRMRFIVSAVTTVVIGFLVVAFASTLSKTPLKDEA